MLKIKLQPVGKKGQKIFRIVVDQARSKLNSSHIDQIGTYNPKTKDFNLDKKALKKWQKNGAQVTIGVDKLINPENYKDLAKRKKANRLARHQKGKEQPEQAKKEEVKATPEEKKEQKSDTKNEST